jgi:formate dehydrogenase subunit gamma
VSIKPTPIDTRIASIASYYVARGEGIDHILQAVRAEFGEVPEGTAEIIAAVSRFREADIAAAIVRLFRPGHTPSGRHVLTLCQAVNCTHHGARAIAAHAQTRLGIGFFETTADGGISLVPAYCLGQCTKAPSGSLDGLILERVAVADIDAIAEGRPPRA